MKCQLNSTLWSGLEGLLGSRTWRQVLSCLKKRCSQGTRPELGHSQELLLPKLPCTPCSESNAGSIPNQTPVEHCTNQIWSPRHAEGQHYLQGEFPQRIQRQSARCLSGVAHLQAGLSSNPPDILHAATASHFRHTGIKTLGLFSACFAS